MLVNHSVFASLSFYFQLARFVLGGCVPAITHIVPMGIAYCWLCLVLAFIGSSIIATLFVVVRGRPIGSRPVLMVHFFCIWCCCLSLLFVWFYLFLFLFLFVFVRLFVCLFVCGYCCCYCCLFVCCLLSVL